MTWPLAIPPYKVQEEALEQARGKRTFAFFMEMGLGKSAVVLAEFTELHRAGKVETLLVICPNSLKGAWQAEMTKMGFACGQVFLINYEHTITEKGHRWLENLLSVWKIYLVFDESTQIKNPHAQRTRVAIAASKAASYVRILSGAPVVQGPQDLWSQLRCLGIFSGMNYYVYRNTYCRMGGYMGKQILGVNPARRDELNLIVSKAGFRARKDDWIDLPRKIYTTREITLSTQQQKHYDEMRRHLVTMIHTQVIDAPMVITQMLKLQQITSGFLIDGGGQAHPISGPNAKLREVLDILEQTTGKVLIFTWFRYSTAVLQDALKDYGALVLQGGMDTEAIEAVKINFAGDPSCRVLICQIQTGKFGHTFLGGPGEQRCATTIFYENSFSLDARIQAEDRNHRIGQDRPVVYCDLVASPIDRVVIAALQKKQDTATAIIDYVKEAA